MHKSRSTILGLNEYAKFGGCYILAALRFEVNIFFSAISEYPTVKLTISKMKPRPKTNIKMKTMNVEKSVFAVLNDSLEKITKDVMKCYHMSSRINYVQNKY